MRFQTKFSLIILPLVAVSVLFMGVWSVRTARQSIETTIHKLMVKELGQFIESNIQANYGVLRKNNLEGVGSFVLAYQQKVFDSISSFHFIETGNIFILDARGNVLAKAFDHGITHDEKFDARVIALANTKKPGNVFTLKTGAGERIFVTQTFAPWNWLLVYSLSRDVILTPQKKIQNTAIGVSMVCIGFGSFLIILGFRFFFGRPVEKLKYAAQRITDLKDVINIDIHSQDELGDLARSMEKMALAIRKYRERQNNWNAYLEFEIEKSTKNLHQANTALEKEVKARKISEAGFRQSEERFKAIFESVTDCILVWNRGYQCLYANQASKQIQGTRQPMVGKNIREVLSPYPEVMKLWMIRVDSVFEIGETIWVEDTMSVGNHTLHSESVLNPIRDQEGKIFAVGLVFRDVTRRKQMEQQIKASLAEKEILLKEIHHRVKNNLQVVSSILKMQSNLITDLEIIRIFRESQNRIASMSLVHEQLYKSENLAIIDFATYITDLVHSLEYSFGTDPDKIRVIVDVRHRDVGVDTAVPCGLIVNELISNAFKYAFGSGEKGQLSVLFQLQDKGMARLVIADTGPGIPREMDIGASQTLGLKLVNNLVTHQLEGNIIITRDQGTRVEINFPFSQEKETRRMAAGENESRGV
jgi:PAS domain S-box-containing protein